LNWAVSEIYNCTVIWFSVGEETRFVDEFGCPDHFSGVGSRSYAFGYSGSEVGKATFSATGLIFNLGGIDELGF